MKLYKNKDKDTVNAWFWNRGRLHENAPRWIVQNCRVFKSTPTSFKLIVNTELGIEHSWYGCWVIRDEFGCHTMSKKAFEHKFKEVTR